MADATVSRMSAYLICDVAVHDRDALTEYLQLAEGTVESYGGRYLAQAGELSTIEGDWTPQTVVVVEFPSTKAAHDWYKSDEYAAALQVMPKAMVRKMIVVDGLETLAA